MSYLTSANDSNERDAQVERAMVVAAGAVAGFVCGRTVGVAFSGSAISGGIPLAILGAAVGHEVWRRRQQLES